MNTTIKRIICSLLAILVAVPFVLSITACNKKNNIPDYVEPTDNDEFGWYSAEVLNEFNAAGFVIPEGAEVTTKPERTILYLKGGENLFTDTCLYAFSAIAPVNDVVYTPECDETGEVKALKEITEINTSELHPAGDSTSLVLVYEISGTINECAISYDETTQLVCISFAHKTSLYKPFI